MNILLEFFPETFILIQNISISPFNSLRVLWKKVLIPVQIPRFSCLCNREKKVTVTGHQYSHSYYPYFGNWCLIPTLMRAIHKLSLLFKGTASCLMFCFLEIGNTWLCSFFLSKNHTPNSFLDVFLLSYILTLRNSENTNNVCKPDMMTCVCHFCHEWIYLQGVWRGMQGYLEKVSLWLLVLAKYTARVYTSFCIFPRHHQ